LAPSHIKAIQHRVKLIIFFVKVLVNKFFGAVKKMKITGTFFEIDVLKIFINGD